MASPQEFGRKVKRFATETCPRAATAKARRAALGIQRGLILVSPVDTGRFRASWFVATRVATLDDVPPKPPKGQRSAAGQSAASATQEIANVRLGDSIHVSNPLPYGPRLNDGWSKQAPRRFVQMVVRSVLSDRTMRSKR